MANLLKPEDPAIEIVRRVREINRDQPPQTEYDAKELREREEAAIAYAGEDENHFVSFVRDCVDTSVNASRNIRQEQRECWDVFNEEPPPNYARKEAWQSRVVVPKPYSSVQFANAIVRKAFDTQFLSIENKRDPKGAEFWKELLSLMLSRNYAKFPIQFTDATGMGFAIGQSMEMIPVWRPGKGLRYILTEPWKIYRDPDSITREPQSGMYWVHQEYLDYWLLKDSEKKGRYQNIGTWGPGGGSEGSVIDPMMTKEEIARRKNQVWGRSGYRSMVLTSEFWGTVLDKRGELLLPNATYTVAAGRVISLPKKSPYPTLRWPGIGFSPLPHLLRFEGRGLVTGIKSLWYFMCSLMSLHADNLNWIVNPPGEIDISALVDPTDVDIYPGKQYLTRGTISGQQSVRTIERRSQTGDVLANLNFADQRYQEGSLFNYAVQGLPGYRAEVTARESAQNLNQSMTIVGLMGQNLEDGALNAITAGAETVAINITYEELAMLMGPEVADRYRVPVSDEFPTGLSLPSLNSGTFSISGISALMRDQEIIHGIQNIILPMFGGQFGNTFAPYFKPYQIIRVAERCLNLTDRGMVVDQTTADRVDQAQQIQQEATIQAVKAKEAAEAALVEVKAIAEQAKAEMQQAKAQEHLGKADLAHAKAASEGTPEAPEAPPNVDEFKGELTLAQTELTQRQADTEVARAQLTLAQAELALAQAHAAMHPPEPSAPATPAEGGGS